MDMPAPDRDTISKRFKLIDAFKKVIPAEFILDSEADRRPFETDGLTAYRQLPMLVVMPETAYQVSEILKLCGEYKTKVVPRGAGTSLSGGALPLADGVLLVMSKFNKILDIDYGNRCVVAQPGVTNLSITNSVSDRGFYYAPDPSSQIVCSVGGNVAENSGGVHCLKYGLTTNNILSVEMVLMNGNLPSHILVFFVENLQLFELMQGY